MVIAAIALVLWVVMGFSMATPLWLLISLIATVSAAYLISRSTLLSYVMIFIAGVGIATINPAPRESNHPLAERINQIAADKISTLQLSPDSESLVEALTLGRRYGMNRALVSAYRHCGASHLLAISGLHIGMVALLLGLIFRPIVLLPYGNIALSMILIGLLWLYTSVVGFTPSVVRSTVMFTVLALNKITTGRYDPLRSLAIAVVIMVAANPSIIYSVGFQLSVVAVLEIIVVAVPIIKFVNGLCRGSLYLRILGFLLGFFIIGIICSVATMPLAYHYFGYFCWWGWILSPLLIAISYLIIAITMIWLLIGFGGVAPLFGWLLDSLCSLQNGILLYFSESI